MRSEQYWIEHELLQLRAKERVHGIDTSKEQRRHQKRLANEGIQMSEAALEVVDTSQKKEPKPRTAAGFSHDAVVSLQSDQEGKKYGNDNNPKRVNSNAHKLFSLYVDGMTVGDFITAGGRASALRYDIEHGYIKVA